MESLSLPLLGPQISHFSKLFALNFSVNVTLLLESATFPKRDNSAAFAVLTLLVSQFLSVTSRCYPIDSMKFTERTRRAPDRN